MATRNRPPSIMAARRRRRHGPNSMVASAAVMTGPHKSNAKLSSERWQAEAWSMYDEVGELRFGVSWLANALSRVNLIAATPPKEQGDEPTPVDVETASPVQKRAVELVEEIAGGVGGQGQLLAAAAKMLTVPGVGYVHATADDLTDSFNSWRVLSNDEARRSGDRTEVADPVTGEWTLLGENDLLIKLWRSHPRKSWEPDSPVRACLEVLHEIVDLSRRVRADARSRLVGNGLLVLPTEAEFPKGQAGGAITSAEPGGGDPDEEDGEGEEADDFVEGMVQVAQIAIDDQGSPAATLPLVIRVPADVVDKVQHIKFYSDFSESLDGLRQAAIKRLALGMDMPPEVLLGLGDTNHWSAWQIAEEAITLQIEPLAELVCHAITIGFLRPALVDEFGVEAADQAILWFDTTELRTRPDLTAAVSEAHARLKVSDAAYLREIGMDVADMPDADELRTRVLLDVAKGAPSLAPAMLAAAGILDPEVADAAAEARTVEVVEGERAPAEPSSDADGGRDIPERSTDSSEANAAVRAAAFAAASDVLVTRALEVCGRRLHAAANKRRPGGSANAAEVEPELLHTTISATEYASLDHLLRDAWARVPTVAERWGVDAESLTACLDGYTRSLIANGHAHEWSRLVRALGAEGACALARSD